MPKARDIVSEIARMVVAIEKPCDQGPKVNQREKNAETEI